MILQVEDWYQGYSQILQDCRASPDSSCLVLCHADVDAMTAARILTFMLRADHVQYTLQPCPSFVALQAAVNSPTTTTNNYAAIVLLNVGGTRNLTRLFDQGNNLNVETTKVYVLDGRRPVHLANIYAGDNIVVFWDPTHGHLDEIPSDGDNLSGNDDDDDDDESSSSESSSGSSENELVDSDDDADADADNSNNNDGEMELDLLEDTHGDARVDNRVETEERPEDDHNDNDKDNDEDMDYDGEDEGDGGRITPQKQSKPKTKTRRQAPRDDSGHSPASHATGSTHALEEDDNEDDDEDDILTAPTQTATTQDTMTQTPTTTDNTTALLTHPERQTQRLERLRLYYSHGSSHGSPTAFVAYRLATQLRFGALPDLLWLSMIGVTDAYLQARLDLVGYATIAAALTEDCHKLFPTENAALRVQDMVHAEDLLVGSSSGGNNHYKTKVTFSQMGRIVPQTDLRLYLLRHSSLLEALRCSSYVSSTLQLWTKPGMQRLQELLAKMGFPLEQCQQPYQFMKPTLRRKLFAKMQEFAPDYGLEELEFTSFVRVTGYSSLTSASDICYAASALLECPTVSARNTSQQKQQQQQLEDWDLNCFHAAYDALGNQAAAAAVASTTTNNRNITAATLQEGIKWAKKLQCLIITTAVGLVKRNAITRLRHFRYAYVTCTSQAMAAGNGGAAEPTVVHSRSEDNPQDNNNNNNNSPSAANNHNNNMEYHVLAKPLALTRLAHYLMDMHRANGKWVGETKTRPLVLLAEQPATSTYLVVGYEMAEKEGQLPANKFGQYFSYVASSFGTNAAANSADGDVQQAKAVARLDSFDAHVVEVDSCHVQKFLESLHYFMDSV